MKANQPLVLIVEDETSIQEMVKLALEMAGFRVAEANDTKQADEKIRVEMPDLLLLDWMLPGQSGIDYLKILRQKKITAHIPIILLTARVEEECKIKGLDVGADDYVTKPFSPRELVMRIKTVLRRGPLVTTDGAITIRNLTLDTHARQVSISGKKLALSAANYQLLYFFMKHQHKVISREHLLTHVWGGAKDVTDRSVDVQVLRLRKILAKHQCDDLIHTVRGIGYQFFDE